MKSILVLVMLAMGVVTSFAQFTETTNYVVTLFDKQPPNVVAAIHRVQPRRMWTNAIHGFMARMTADQANRVARDSRVKYIEVDSEVTTLAQTTPTGVQRIGTLENSIANIGAQQNLDVDIAIMDTGIQLDHPDLRVFANTTFVTNTVTGNDDNGHGTHVAGIAAAKDNTIGVVGVAPGARLWAVKVLNASGSGLLSSILSGVNYVYNNASSIEVVNMSFGGQGIVSSLRDAIVACVNSGVIFTVAAGNSSFEIYGADMVLGTYNDFWPASYPEVMTISALGDFDGLPGGLSAITKPNSFCSASFSGGLIKDDTLACFSNYSANPDPTITYQSPGGAIAVAAPGVNIYSTYTNSTYATLSGTSMAAPHVAGAMALYCIQYGKPTTAAEVYAIEQRLINGAEPQSQWGQYPPNSHSLDAYPEGLVRIGLDAAQTNQFPTTAISSPANGASFTATNRVSFVGTSTDPEDGNISAGMIWRSSINGILATNSSFNAVLANGNHAITAASTDSDTNTSTAQIFIYVNVTSPNTSTNTAPTVAITAPANGSSYQSGASITFTGTATDTQEGSLTSSLTWNSNIDGVIGTGGSFSKNDLTVGTHFITASAKDTPGLTGSANITVYVTAAPPASTATTATVTSDRTTYINKMKARLTANVKALGVNLSGATVNYTVTSANGRRAYQTATTDSSGNTIYNYNINSRNSGTGTYQVRVDVSKSGYLGTNATTTFTVTQ